MKKITHTEIYQQEESANKWTVPVVDGKLFYQIEAVYDENKKILDVPYTVTQSFNNLIIDFGFDVHIGYAKYSWVEYVEDGADQNSVIVNVNNSDCCDNATPVDEFKTVSFANDKDIKVAELSANCVMIDYLLKSNNGEMEAGRITIIDGVDIKLDASRNFNNDLLPVDFSANRNNDAINLHISLNTEATYDLKYKSTIF